MLVSCHFFGPYKVQVFTLENNLSLPLVVWHVVIQFKKDSFTNNQVNNSGNCLFLTPYWSLISEKSKSVPLKSIQI